MIRVLRVMEYEYETIEAANADMARWQVPPTGDKKFGPLAPMIRSSVMLPQAVTDDDLPARYEGR